MRGEVTRFDRSTWGPGMEPLVLVEPNIDLGNGHWGDTVAMLATAAVQQGRAVFVTAPRPPVASLAQTLEQLGVPVMTPGRLGTLERLLGRVAAWLGRREAVRRSRGRHASAEDLWLVRVLIDEILSLRLARRVGPTDATVVLLTGSSAYVGLAAFMSRCRHVRVLHEVRTPVGRWGAYLSALRLDVESRVGIVCPTHGVAAALPADLRGCRVSVRPFALNSEDLYVTAEERARERSRRDFADGDLVVAIVGGWWPAKDIDTVIEALSKTARPVRAVVVGHPIDSQRLEPVARHMGDRLSVDARPLRLRDLRSVYAAADVSVVSRHPGVVKESGLVLDSLRYGVHLVVSDHDPALTEALRRLDHVTVFRAGDPAALTSALDLLAETGTRRPGPNAAPRFGLLTAAEAIAAFCSWSVRNGRIHPVVDPDHLRESMEGDVI